MARIGAKDPVGLSGRISRVLIVNPGSSSLKLRVLERDDRVAAQEDLKALEGKAELDSLQAFLAHAGDLDAAGVRVVHGGADFNRSIVVDTDMLEQLDQVSELAPLHNPPALAAMRSLRQLRPKLPVVACFDTAFHATLPAEAHTYAVPLEWREWGVRRYGFHGLSHSYASRRVAEMTGARLDQAANRSAHPDAAIGARDSLVQLLVITAREDLEIAREVRNTLTG